ncbi:MAG: sodium:solute symporter [Firmicutes bacterium]|nr:sodium:solute symporter [Bacillota bacterium]
MRLSGLDLAILMLYLAAVTAIGLWFRRGQHDIRDYFLGRRETPWWALALSIVATETSTLTVVSTPALAFAENFQFLQLVLGYIVGRVVVALLFIPQFFRGEFYTAYQLIETRFGARMKSAAAATFLMTRALADGVRITAIALVVQVAFGIGELWSVAIVLGLTLLYTFQGGLKAVIWTDVVQLGIYLGGAVVALGLLVGKLPGGWSEVSAVAAAHGKFQIFDFTWDWTTKYTFWAGVLGGMFLTMASHGTDQLMVQRLLAARSERDSKRALLASAVLVFLQFALFLLIGVLLFVFYGAPAIVPGQSYDAVFPQFIVQEMPAGLRGLMVAAIFAAAMSTTSSTLNALASSSIVDFYRLHGETAEPERLLRLSRWMTLVWGAVLFVLGLVRWGPLLEAGLMIASITYGSLLGLFVLGLLHRGTTAGGALVGMFAGLAGMLYVRFATPVAWTWYVLVGTLITVLVGVVASWVERQTTAHLEEH